MLLKNIGEILLGSVTRAVGIFGSISLGQHIGTYLGSKINLNRINQYEQQGYVIADSQQIANRYNSIQNPSTLDYTGKEELRQYMNILNSNLGPNVKLARANFSTLRLIKSKSIALTGAAGQYNGGENTIKYVSAIPSILGHELLHMASYMYDNTTDTSFHGFMQYKNKTKLGVGLNEGYTELLTSRLFNNNQVTAYHKLARIAKLFEDFFPNQNMADYYFRCDLPGFIHHMEQFTTREEIIKIILDMDQIYLYEKVLASPVPTIKETQIAARLYKIYANYYASNPTKVAAYKNKVCSNKLTSMVVNNTNMRLTRTNPFVRFKNGFKRGWNSVKNFFQGQSQPVTPTRLAYTR